MCKKIKKSFLSQFGDKCKRSVNSLQDFWLCFYPIDAINLHLLLHFVDFQHIIVMDFGSRLKEIRTQKGIKREELAAKLGTSSAIVGRYERNERTPSIETATKIAQALEVSLDFLVGDASVLVKDKKMIYRLEMLDSVSPEDQERILYILDLMLKDAQSNNFTQKLSA